jgi:hypothetical protein
MREAPAKDPMLRSALGPSLATQTSDNDVWRTAGIAADPLVAAVIKAEALTASVHETGVKLAAKP